MRSSVEKHFGAVTSIRGIPEYVGSSTNGRKFSGNASYVTAGRDSMLHFWDTEGECVGSITAHRGSVNSISGVNCNLLYSPSTQDIPIVLSSGGAADGIVKLWDARKLKLIQEIPAGACSKLLWTGQTFVGVTSAGTIKAWNYLSRKENLEAGVYSSTSNLLLPEEQQSIKWFGTDVATVEDSECEGKKCTDIVQCDRFLAAGFKSGEMLRLGRM